MRHQSPAGSPPARAFAWMRWIPIVLVVVGALVAVLYLTAADPIQVHAEAGPIERTQTPLWIGTALAALAIVLLQHHRHDRLNAVWLLVVAVLATARELDLHEQLNEESLGAWAVSFKIQWWLSPETPVGIRLLWIGVALTAGLGLLLPPLLIRAPAVSLLRAGDAGTWLFGLGVGCYAVGYLMDDILGRGRLLTEEPGQAIEEIAELFGVIAILASTVVTMRHPLTERIGRLHRRADPDR